MLKKNGVQIQPAGAHAANLVGLSEEGHGYLPTRGSRERILSLPQPKIQLVPRVVDRIKAAKFL